jgi:predicted nucleic acid-binding protein
MAETSSTHDVLVRLSQYVGHREVDGPAKNCQMGLIKTVLFHSGNSGLNISEIIAGIEKQMGFKNFPETVIKQVVSSKEKGLIEKGGKYFLSNETFQEVEKLVTRRKASLEFFQVSTKRKVQERMKVAGLNSNLPEITIQLIYEILAEWFGSESKTIADSFKVLHQLIQPIFPDRILERKLSKIEDEKSRNIAHDVIMETFQDPSPDISQLLFDMLQNYLNIELLNADPECRYLEKIAFSKKTLVLDTNVLIALLLEADYAHKGVKETVSISKDLGINLVMTKRTESEWLAALENANNQYLAINIQRPSFIPYMGDVFIQTFLKRKGSESSLTWNGFYLQMKQIKFMAYDKGVSLWYKKEFDLDKLPNHDFFEALSQYVFTSSRREKPKNRNACEHDAYHLLLIRKLRDEAPADILGPSCWFLTLDTTLINADNGLNKLLGATFDPPSSFMVDMWIPVITPFLGPEISDKRLSEAFAHLMTTHFATFSSKNNAEMVIETLGKWLPYEKLTNQQIVGILNDSLLKNYYSQLKEAKIKDPSKIEASLKKVQERVDEKVFELWDDKVAEAEQIKQRAILEAQEAKKSEQAKDLRLALSAKQNKRVLDVCLGLGIIFALFGLCSIVFNDLSTGLALIISGIIFLALSLGFNHFKVKGGPLEVEADK